jgi:Plant transposon protein
VDCTHIHWANCPAGLANLYTGKEKVPTIAYEVTVDHTKKILYVSRGHPGSRNDKTIVKTDEFLQAIRNKEILYDDVEFVLYREDGSSFTVKGAYLISDNGYAKWRMLQAPIKSSSSLDEMKWSTRLESVRKDVECTFGILKIRFRILRARILFHTQERVDNVFYAACVMHNMLLTDDGLDTGWDAEEEGDDDDLRDGLEMRRIRLRLVDQRALPILPGGLRNIAEHNHDAEGDDIDESHYTFRTQLIAHYKYCKEHNLVQWLTRANAN